MAELNLEIVYRPGKKNVVADVLSQYGAEGAVEATASAWYSLSDRSVRRVMYELLNVVTSTWALMIVLHLRWRHLHANCHLKRLHVASVEPYMVTWVSMHILYILYITVACVATNGQKYPRYVEIHYLRWDASCWKGYCMLLSCQ